jgi:hypothetical protein
MPLETLDICEEKNKKTMCWPSDSSGRAPANQAWGPDSKPQFRQKNKNNFDQYIMQDTQTILKWIIKLNARSKTKIFYMKNVRKLWIWQRVLR